jgi:cob(I)alamin adenosyltransferase
MVVLNRIYTRTGDDGTTALGSGERRPKYDLRVSAFGTVDETNAAIGIVRLHLADARDLDAMLGLIQNDLFDLGADLSVPFEPEGERLRVTQAQVDELERLCDEHNARLPQLKSFVLPGGSELAARLHVARAVCRRAELAALTAAEQTPIDPLVTVYLNRLSDLLFVLARSVNAQGEEVLWQPGGPGAT